MSSTPQRGSLVLRCFPCALCDSLAFSLPYDNILEIRQRLLEVSSATGLRLFLSFQLHLCCIVHPCIFDAGVRAVLDSSASESSSVLFAFVCALARLLPTWDG